MTGPLALALLLDAAMGEPRWLWSRLPHPAVLMGRAVGWIDTHLNTGSLRRAKGIAAIAALCCAAGAIGAVLSVGGPLIEAVTVAILLAQKSLVQHVAAVATGLRMSLAQAKRDVSMIVGRDTTDMTAPDIARAAIESGAENLSDGVIAPAFWFLIAGLPGILIYKVVNTADSMIGYRTPRHEAFGWAAARLDDVLNWIPARLTAVLILVTALPQKDVRGIIQDAGKHRSPNAGWPEAAMARALGIALSGPRSYDGERRDFPWVNESGRRDAGAEDIDAAVRQLWYTWALALALLVAAVVLD